MFSSFWEWAIIILFLVVIFEADNIHLWKASARQKLENIKQNIENKQKNSNKDSSSKE